MTTRTVRYRNWWNDFNPSRSFIPRLMARAVGGDLSIVHDSKIEVDYEVHSVFCNQTFKNRVMTAGSKRSKNLETRRAAMLRADYGIGMQGPARRHIWYTGENLRPPTDWDVTLSFDIDPLLGANWYLPHWAIRLGDLDGHDPHDAFQVRSCDLTSSRDAPEGRPRFAALLAGNPHPMRSTLLDALSEIGRVDASGTVFGRPVSSKFEKFRHYRFAVVPENDLYPGYVTEKVIEAWMAGCIPIWWGIDAAGFLNQEAFVNLANMSLHQLVTEVRDIDLDPERLKFMTSQPILKRPYDFDACVNFIRTRLEIPTQ